MIRNANLKNKVKKNKKILYKNNQITYMMINQSISKLKKALKP